MDKPNYRRVIVKLSGEALSGPEKFGIHQPTIDRFAADLVAAHKLGIALGVVVGGGNVLRGAQISEDGLSRPTADAMGMLATVMNALVLVAAIERAGVEARAMSALIMPQVCETYERQSALRHLEARPHHRVRRWHRQSVLHHRHDRGAARRRDGVQRRPQGDRCRRRLYGRSEEGSDGDPLRASRPPGGARTGGSRSWMRRLSRLPRKTGCLSSCFRSGSSVRSRTSCAEKGTSPRSARRRAIGSCDRPVFQVE